MDWKRFIFDFDYRYLKRKQFEYNVYEALIDVNALERLYKRGKFGEVDPDNRQPDDYFREYKFLKGTGITRKLMEDFSPDGFLRMAKSYVIALVDPIYRQSINRMKTVDTRNKYNKLKERYGDRPNILQDLNLARLEHKMNKLSVKSRNTLAKVSKTSTWHAHYLIKARIEMDKILMDSSLPAEERKKRVLRIDEYTRKIPKILEISRISEQTVINKAKKVLLIKGYENPDVYSHFEFSGNPNFKEPEIKFEKNGFFKKKMIVENDPFINNDFTEFKINNAPNFIDGISTSLFYENMLSLSNNISEYNPYKYMDYNNRDKSNPLSNYIERVEKRLSLINDRDRVRHDMYISMVQAEASKKLENFLGHSLNDFDPKNKNKLLSILNDNKLKFSEIIDPENIKALLIKENVKDKEFLKEVSSFMTEYNEVIDKLDSNQADYLDLKNHRIKASLNKFSPIEVEEIQEKSEMIQNGLKIANIEDRVKEVKQVKDINISFNSNELIKINMKEDKKDEFEP